MLRTTTYKRFFENDPAVTKKMECFTRQVYDMYYIKWFQNKN